MSGLGELDTGSRDAPGAGSAATGPCRQHGQHAGTPAWKMPLTPQHPSCTFTYTLRLCETAANPTFATRREGPGGSGTVTGAPSALPAPGSRTVPLPPLGTGAPTNPGRLLGRRPRCGEPGWPGSSIRELRGRARREDTTSVMESPKSRTRGQRRSRPRTPASASAMAAAGHPPGEAA